MPSGVAAPVRTDLNGPGVSLAGIGFAVLVIAIDFAVVRKALVDRLPPGSAGPSGSLLPHMLADTVYNLGPAGPATFAFFLLPMIDVLLIRAYLLRRSDGRTAGAVGSLVAGSAATLTVFLIGLVGSEMAIRLILSLSRPAALGMIRGLACGFGQSWLRSRGMEWTFVILFALVFPMALACGLPLLAAFIGGRVARRFGRGGTTAGAGCHDPAGGIGDLGRPAPR